MYTNRWHTNTYWFIFVNILLFCSYNCFIYDFLLDSFCWLLRSERFKSQMETERGADMWMQRLCRILVVWKKYWGFNLRQLIRAGPKTYSEKLGLWSFELPNYHIHSYGDYFQRISLIICNAPIKSTGAFYKNSWHAINKRWIIKS